MMRWCSIFVIISLLAMSLQFPSDHKGTYHDWTIRQESTNGSFESCQYMLSTINHSLIPEDNIYKLLQNRGVDDWIFDYSDETFSCISQEFPKVIFSWNSERDSCINLNVLGVDGDRNITEHLCDLKMEKPNFTRRRRSLSQKTITSYINVAKEMEITECSTPILTVYLNEELIFSNGTGVTSKDGILDTISVFIGINYTSFTNIRIAQTSRQFFVNEELRSFSNAEQYCHQNGMKLATIRSKEEMYEVNKIQTGHFHLWAKKNTLDIQTYWAANNPNQYDGNDRCFYICPANSFWSEDPCGTLNPVICESADQKEEVPPTVKVYVDDYLAYQNISGNQEESNTVIVIIGVKGDDVNDHTMQFSLLKKNSTQEVMWETKLIIPEAYKKEDFDGIDIRVENMKQKGLICRKDKVYHAFTERKLNYVDGENFCQNRSMQLASIQDEKQQLEIERLMLSHNIDHYYWTSGRLAADGATWLWSENEPVTYSFWAKGEPNNLGGNEKCIELFVPFQNAKWNDQDCTDKNRIICENFVEPYWYLPEL